MSFCVECESQLSPENAEGLRWCYWCQADKSDFKSTRETPWGMKPPRPKERAFAVRWSPKTKPVWRSHRA